MTNPVSNSQSSPERRSPSPDFNSHRRKRHHSNSYSRGRDESRTVKSELSHRRSRSRSRSRGSRSRRDKSRSRSRGIRRDRRREKRRRTGWDDAPAETSEPSATSFATSLAPQTSLLSLAGSAALALHQKSPEKTEKELQERQAQAANVAVMMQTKASLSQLCRIYIGSLDYSLTEADIRSVFSPFGQIVNIDMPKEGARSKGFCFVEYTSPESAEMALTTMQGFILKGRSIKVGRPTALGGQSANAGLSTLMANLGGMGVTNAPAATSQMGMNLFGSDTDNAAAADLSAAQAGVMAAASLIASRPTPAMTAAAAAPFLQNTATPTSTMSSTSSAMSSIPGLNLSQLSAQSVQNRVYVGSVPYSFTADDVKQIFQVFGPVVSCQLIPSNERPGTHRGYGFIEYANQDQCKLAIETMNGFEVGGKQLKVNYATALRNMSPGQVLGFDNLSPNSLAAGFGSPTSSINGSGLSPVGQGTFGEQGMMNMGDEFLTSHVSEFPTSPIIMLTNMVSPEDVDEFLNEEIRQECQKYGSIVEVHIEILSSGVRIFVTFSNAQEAAGAVPHLQSRWFDGRQIQCKQYDPQAYAESDYSL